MKKYTIGILFDQEKDSVMLIKKVKPEWQAGKLNFPGGKIEEGENEFDCVAREFVEEAHVDIPPSEWVHIGRINNEDNYLVEIFMAIYDEDRHGDWCSMTDEKIDWYAVTNLPKNVIHNIPFLVGYALYYYFQGNADKVHFSTFEYRY